MLLSNIFKIISNGNTRPDKLSFLIRIMLISKHQFIFTGNFRIFKETENLLSINGKLYFRYRYCVFLTNMSNILTVIGIENYTEYENLCA